MCCCDNCRLCNSLEQIEQARAALLKASWFEAKQNRIFAVEFKDKNIKLYETLTRLRCLEYIWWEQNPNVSGIVQKWVDAVISPTSWVSSCAQAPPPSELISPCIILSTKGSSLKLFDTLASCHGRLAVGHLTQQHD